MHITMLSFKLQYSSELNNIYTENIDRFIVHLNVDHFKLSRGKFYQYNTMLLPFVITCS